MTTPAALTVTTDRDEAKARYALVDATIAQLTLSAFPQLVLTQVGTFEDPEWVLVCPWCGKHMPQSDGIINVDCAIRWNYGTYDPDTEAVEVMARAEADADSMPPWHCDDDPNRPAYLRRARAALAALREHEAKS